jgi:hypothetical protein
MTEPAKRINQTRHWPQFSLRSALILIAVFGVAASLWVSIRQSRENRQLRQENTRLRNETGQLTIEPGAEYKVHAIAVPELEARTWRWRVYIPDGRPLGLQVKSKSENGSGSSWSLLSPGEHTIVIALRRDVNDRWEWVIRSSQDASSGETRHTAAGNVEKLINNYWASSGGVGQATQSVEPGNDLELLKFETAGSNFTDSISVAMHEGPP